MDGPKAGTLQSLKASISSWSWSSGSGRSEKSIDEKSGDIARCTCSKPDVTPNLLLLFWLVVITAVASRTAGVDKFIPNICGTSCRLGDGGALASTEAATETKLGGTADATVGAAVVKDEVKQPLAD
jgi:hypothetical protein